MTAKSVMKPLSNNAVVKEGSLLLKVKISRKERARYAIGSWKEIAMVFQDPMTSLDPTMKIKNEIQKNYQARESLKEEANKRAEELLEFVGIQMPRAYETISPTNSLVGNANGEAAHENVHSSDR